jgi:cytochrome P450 family 142 subfamily A polypeptide 1
MLSSKSAREIDLLDGEWYASGPYEDYAWLRREEPLYWDSVNELWGVSRYDDIVEIEKRKDVFVNSDQTKGGYRPNTPADSSIIGLDDPLHQKRRSLVSRRFTPKAATLWHGEIRASVTALLDAVESNGGEAEIVGELAAPLPAMMIGKLLGFDEERWHDLQDWSERTIALGGGPRSHTDAGVIAAMEFAQAAVDALNAKRSCPGDDILSQYTSAEIDGLPLTESEVVADSLLLLDGGAETTRTVIARSLLNLVEHPAQWAKLKAGADLTVATEELIRYVTPIHNMCRVAAEEAEVAGKSVPPGHQLLLMYGSANRDEQRFASPETFDVARTPNPHIAFGFGTHFCLGAALARLEIKTFFGELVRRVESFCLTPGTEPVEMPNAFVFGLKSAQLEFKFEQ